jgi:exoribonuclease-2
LILKSKKMFLDNTISALEDALFTGASEKGTWVRLFQPPVEGKLIQGFEGLDVGDRVRVELIGTM